jgi:saccharopine dehydrogenase-like NADP-dependent oxidoreductase
MNRKKVIILGGYGTFGSLITDQLAKSDVNIVVVGRDAKKGNAFTGEMRCKFASCDTRDKSALRKVIAEAFLVINATGPFQKADFSIPEICIDEHCHYIDIADGREYVSGFSVLDERAKHSSVFACTGASTAPAVTSVIVNELQKQIQEIASIKSAMNPGNRNQAGLSTIKSILSYVGSPFNVWKNGTWEISHGWEEGETIPFPLPVGKRRVHLCNVPDLELFPKLYKADTVIFKAGVELDIFNHTIELLGLIRKRIPSLNLASMANLLIMGSKVFKFMGTTAGGLNIQVTGRDGQRASIAIIAQTNGPRIPAAPAVILTQKLIKGEMAPVGAFPCIGFIAFEELVDYLSPFDIKIQKS